MNNIKTTLLELGIPANQLGFGYLADGISIYLGDNYYRCEVTTRLYPAIADKNNSTPPRVERAIRHAIETAFFRNKPDAIEKFFHNSVDPAKGKPTNSAFIATIAMALREDVEE